MSRSPLALSILLATGLLGQTVESIPFRAVLSSGNETQQPASPVTGTATIWLHIVRDATGAVVSGSADAAVNYNFTTASTATAMHIHKGAGFVNGSIVLPFALARTDVNGKGTFPVAQTNFPSSSVTRGLSSICVRRGDASSHMLIVVLVPVKLNPVGPPGQTLVVETVTASAKPKGMMYCGPFSSRRTR